MRIYIMDLDGTLMPSAEVDNHCYWRAVQDVYGRPEGSPSPGAFRHITDRGILEEWLRGEFGRDPAPDELAQVRQRFLERLGAAADEQPEAFTPMPGLHEWLDALAAGGGRAGVATGGWGHSARFKLRRAGLERHALPLASADDDIARTGIMRIALERVLPDGHGAQGAPTYIGDGPWDAHCSAELGWSFIGIASGARAERLRRAGARHVCPDFRALLDRPVNS